MTKLSRKPGDQFFLLHPNKSATLQLPVPIDGEHSARINERLAAITTELLDQEAKKKQALEPYNKRLAELRQSQKNLVGELKAGQTTALVPVEERANYEDGTAFMVRKDTGLEVPNTRRPLTLSERNAFRPAAEGGDPERVYPQRVTDEDPDAEDDDGDDEEEGEESTGGLANVIDVVVTAQSPMSSEYQADGVNVEGVAEAADTRVALTRSDGMPGWGFYLHQGYLYFRAPNVDSFEPAGRPGDFGPFGWKEADKQVDAMPEAATVDNDWMAAHDKLLEDADRAIATGKLLGKVKPYRATEATPEADGTPSTGPDTAEGDSTSDDAGGETGVQALGEAVTTLDRWKRLTDPARKVLRFLCTVPAADTVVIGGKTGTKAGAVVPALLGKGYVEHVPEPKTPAHYAVTPQGRELVAAGDVAKSGAKPNAPPAPSAPSPEGDVPY